jgi:hypothetical protein
MELECPKEKSKPSKQKKISSSKDHSQASKQKGTVEDNLKVKTVSNTVSSTKLTGETKLQGPILPFFNTAQDGQSRKRHHEEDKKPLKSPKKQNDCYTKPPQGYQNWHAYYDEGDKKRKQRLEQETKHAQEVTKARIEKEEKKANKKSSLALLGDISNLNSDATMEDLENTPCIEAMKGAKELLLALRKEFQKDKTESKKFRERLQEHEKQREDKFDQKLDMIQEQLGVPLPRGRKKVKSPASIRASQASVSETYKTPPRSSQHSPVGGTNPLEMSKQQLPERQSLVSSTGKTPSPRSSIHSPVGARKKPPDIIQQQPSVMSRQEIKDALDNLNTLWVGDKKDKSAAKKLAKKLQLKLQMWNCNYLPIDYSNMVKDRVSLKLIKKYLRDMISFIPLKTTGDGSCLYNAISLYLFGHEKFALELRLRAATYQIIHEKELKVLQKNSSWGENCYVDFDKEVEETLNRSGYGSSLTIEVLARVTQIKISAVFPYIEGYTGFHHKIELTASFNAHAKHTKKNAILMWTSMEDVGKYFRVNHFVPIVSRDEFNSKGVQKTAINVTSSSENDKPSAIFRDIISLTKQNDEEAKVKVEPASVRKSPSPLPSEDESNSSSEPKNALNFEGSRGYQSPKLGDKVQHHNKSSEEEVEVEGEVIEIHHMSASSGSTIGHLKSEMWLPIEKAISLGTKRRPLDKLPLGKKGNRAFVMKNTRNYNIFKAKLNAIPKGVAKRPPKPAIKLKRKRGPQMAYPDDRCAYKAPSQNYYLHQLVDEKMICLETVQVTDDGLFTLSGDGLTLNPGDEQTFLTKFTYHKAKNAKSDFSKKTTEFMVTPESHKNLEGLTVVEYKGEDPKGAPHGNATKVIF